MNKKEFNKLYLNCKRGILELDIILISFLKSEFLNLKIEELDDLKSLLFSDDQDLYSWIIKSEKTNNIKFDYLIFKIRKFISNHEFK